MTLTFDLLTLKVVSESRVTWAISVPVLVFLGLSVLDLGQMYATDRRQTKASPNAPAYSCRGHNKGRRITEPTKTASPVKRQAWAKSLGGQVHFPVAHFPLLLLYRRQLNADVCKTNTKLSANSCD